MSILVGTKSSAYFYLLYRSITVINLAIVTRKPMDTRRQGSCLMQARGVVRNAIHRSCAEFMQYPCLDNPGLPQSA